EAAVVAIAAATVAIGMALAGSGLAFASAWILPAELDPLLARAAAFGAVGVLTAAAGGFVVLRRGAQRGPLSRTARHPAPEMPPSRPAPRSRRGSRRHARGSRRPSSRSRIRSAS